MRKKNYHINTLCFWGFLALFFVCAVSASGARFYSHTDSFRKNLCSFENKKDATDTSAPLSKLLFIDDNEETKDDDLNHPVSSPVFSSAFKLIKLSFTENYFSKYPDNNSFGKPVSLHVFIRKFLI